MPRHQIPKPFAPLFKPKRWKAYFGGRGGVKSWSFGQALLLRGWEKPLRILCTRELQGSIKDSVHKLLSDLIERMGLEHFYTVTNNAITGANGTEFFFLGIKHDPKKIKSTEGVDICWVEEAEAVSAASWRFLIPTIRKPGSEIWVSFNIGLKTDATYQRLVAPFLDDMRRTGTVEEGVLVSGHFEDARHYICKVSWRDNPWFSQEMRDEMEADKQRDYEEYLHVWEGELKQFADGAIYGQQLKDAQKQGRITTVPIEKVETYTFWDLGRNDHTAIWFMQRIGLQNRFIDYYESRLVDLDHYARVLKEKGYNYGMHYLPHDAEVKVLGMKETRQEMLEGMGVKPTIIVPVIRHINEGIELTRKAFPSCWFDAERCERGLDALRSYQYLYDEAAATHRQTPYHNWASNGADAFRQFAQGFTPPEEEKWKPLDIDTDWIV